MNINRNINEYLIIQKKLRKEVLTQVDTLPVAPPNGATGFSVRLISSAYCILCSSIVELCGFQIFLPAFVVRKGQELQSAVGWAMTQPPPPKLNRRAISKQPPMYSWSGFLVASGQELYSIVELVHQKLLRANQWIQ